MAKNKNTRLLQLMELVNWKGRNNWQELREELQNDAVPGFKDWLYTNMKYIRPDDAKEAVRLWFLEGKSGTPGEAFYIKKDRGISVLVGLSLYQQEQQNGRTN